jgi:uncharacterized caspase-like protein
MRIKLFICIAVWFCGLAEAAPQRIALVIGNQKYAKFPSLNNSANDAVDVAKALKELGFSMVGKEANLNASRADMVELIGQFSSKVGEEDLAVFYYAGHGMAFGGDNYLIPSDDSRINYRDDVPDMAYGTQALLKRLEARKGVNIIIIDACRNNPLPPRGTKDRSASMDRGLRQVAVATGTAMLMAASEGQTAQDGSGRNGVFTGALLTNLKRPGLSLFELFQAVAEEVERVTDKAQTPWQSGNWKGAVVLRAGMIAPPINPIMQPSPTVDPTTIELAYWDSIKGSNDPALFQAYLKEYPNGRFASVARLKARPAVAPAPSPSPVPVPTPNPAPTPRPINPQASSEANRFFGDKGKPASGGASAFLGTTAVKPPTPAPTTPAPAPKKPSPSNAAEAFFEGVGKK